MVFLLFIRLLFSLVVRVINCFPKPSPVPGSAGWAFSGGDAFASAQGQNIILHRFKHYFLPSGFDFVPAVRRGGMR